MSNKKKTACHDYEGRAYAEGYDQGVWDTENRLGDDIAEAQGDTVALESIAAQTVAYFGDLATTLRELPNLRPREVDVLKRVTRDAPITVVGGAPHYPKTGRRR